MSLTGSLEDVSVADLLQFIHLGGRSGTLIMTCDDARAEIGFHRGRIIVARGPNTKRLGDLLVARGAIAMSDLQGALRAQKRASRPTALGQILIEIGALTPQQLKDVFERSVEETIYELVTWSQGFFEFAVDDLKPVDDLSLYPGDILPDIHINTQMVLLEAARILDERNRQLSTPPEPSLKKSTVAPHPSVNKTKPALKTISSVQQPVAAATQDSPKLRMQVVSDDMELVENIGELASEYGAIVVQVSSRDGGTRLHGEDSPVVLIDMRRGRNDVQLVASIGRMRPGAALIVITDGTNGVSDSAYLAGALSVVPADKAVIGSALQAVMRVRTAFDDSRRGRDHIKAGAAKLRRVFGEFRSGLVTATISLNLLNLVSESVERAVLFVVTKSDLMVLGAFGTAISGESLAQKTRGFRLDMEAGGALADSLKDARFRTLTFDDARFPEDFVSLIGRPSSGECAVFPLVGSHKVIAMLYADNGTRHRPIDDVEFLDMATSQVGMFYENELLRRQMGNQVKEVV